jgi:hypothetical protein
MWQAMSSIEGNDDSATGELEGKGCVELRLPDGRCCDGYVMRTKVAAITDAITMPATIIRL